MFDSHTGVADAPDIDDGRPVQTGAPGVSGRLRFDIRGWNM